MPGDVVAGIDDDGLAPGVIAEDGAVAPQQADGKDLVDVLSIIVALKNAQAIQTCAFAKQNAAPTCSWARIAAVSAVRRGPSAWAARAREQDGERKREHHGVTAPPVVRRVRRLAAPRRLRRRSASGAAEGGGEISGLALLQQDDADREEADDDHGDDPRKMIMGLQGRVIPAL